MLSLCDHKSYANCGTMILVIIYSYRRNYKSLKFTLKENITVTIGMKQLPEKEFKKRCFLSECNIPYT